jgi:hypothetical protein
MRNLRNKLLNRFDRALLSGSFSAVLMLFVGTTVLIVVGAAIVSISGVHATRDELNFVDSMWEIVQRVIDPGQLAGEDAWSSRLILLTITIFGLLLVSTLISIINSGLEYRIEGIRRGRRPVNLVGHIVIIGWNDAASKLLEELAIARIEGVDVSVVVFTDDDPIELLNYITDHIHREDEIDQATDTARNVASWVTIRRARGDKTNDLLELGRIDQARALICLLEERNEHRNTRIVLAALSALHLSHAQRREENEPLQVVVQFESEDIAQRFKRRIDRVVGARQESFGALLNLQVVTPDLVRNKIEVNVVRSKGLSAVYKDLLDLSGDEIYLVKSPHPNIRFGSLIADDSCIPLGFAAKENVNLWPDWEMEVGDSSIVVLGKSMKHVQKYMGSWDGFSPDIPFSPRIGRQPSTTPEHYLFVGQNMWLPSLIRELTAVVPNLSTGTLLLHDDEKLAQLPFFAGNSMNVVHRTRTQDPLDDDKFISKFDHVIVMADYDVDVEQSDSRALSDVLACRVHLETRKNSTQPMTVVAELRKRASKHIAAVRMADDLLVSDSLTACAMAQFALYPENGEVLRHLLGSESPVFLQSIPISGVSSERSFEQWADVRDFLRTSTGEIAIALRGFDRQSGIPRVTMNPKDDAQISLDDDVVVLTRLNIAAIQSDDGRE